METAINTSNAKIGEKSLPTMRTVEVNQLYDIHCWVSSLYVSIPGTDSPYTFALHSVTSRKKFIPRKTLAFVFLSDYSDEKFRDKSRRLLQYMYHTYKQVWGAQKKKYLKKNYAIRESESV